jgi:tetratricopeptide (TPR) repeat protein
MADRYTYVPLIGLFIIVAWGVPELAARWRYQRPLLAVSMGAAISSFAICAYSQVGHWDNATTLFKRAVDVTTNNYVAQFNLGLALAKQGRPKEAISHYSEALRINPAWAEAHNILGNALARQGNLRRAVSHYSEALRINPAMAEAHNNLGLALQMLGRVEEAVPHFREALRIKPDYPHARHNLGTALAAREKID